MALNSTNIKVKLRYPTVVLTPQPAGTLSIGTILVSNGIVIANTLTINSTSFAGLVNTSGDFTISGVHTHQSNLVFGSTATIIANGSFGSNGQVLSSNGTGLYWSTPTGGLLAGNGLTSNTTHYLVNSNTGIVVNSFGVFVNSAYIATISSNDSINLNGQPASYYTNATNINTGTLDTTRLPATANISTAINIGANVNLTTSGISVGNATVNTTINATSFSGTSNNSTNFSGLSLATVQDQITGNAATAYSNAIANAAALYQTTAGLSANVLTLTSNAAGFLGNSSGTIANIASWITGNAATAYSNAVANAAALYQTTAGLSANVLVLTSNASGFLSNSSGTLANIASWVTGNAATAYSNAIANAAALYQTTTGLSANVLVLTSNAAGFLGNSSGTLANIASWVTGNAATAYSNAITIASNATNLTTGTVGSARLATGTANSTTVLYGNGVWAAVTGGSANPAGANTQIQFNDSGVFGATSDYTFDKVAIRLNIGNSTVNTTINSTAIVLRSLVANGSVGTSGQILTSNGTGLYWSTPTGGGLLAGNGLTSNASHYAVLANTGIIANSTGTFLDTTYTATLTVNAAGFLGNSSGTIANIASWVTGNAATAYSNAVANAAAIYQTTAGLSANVLILTSNAAGFLGNSSGTIANIASWVTGNAATAYSNSTTFSSNATNLTSGTVGTARLASGTANSTTYLRGDQTWATVTGGSANPSGANTEIQFNDSGSFGASNNYTFDKVSIKLTIGNTTVNTTINSTSLTLKSLIANGSVGTSGQILTSNGTGLYWSTPTGGGLSAGDGLTSNSSHYSVLANTGIVANSTGVFANAAYIDSRITASDKISSNTSPVIGSDPITNIITCSQGEYDGATKYANTLYVIV